ncbi:MAG: VWA domain-containing protein, partial [Phycisphaerae bacterium]|nr:VWA domain-containing protein [Phycisphaerae bacterium]
MGLIWLHPWRLIMAVAVALLLTVLLVRSRRMTWRWKLRCLVWPALATMFWAGAAAEPFLQVAPRTDHIVALLDLSAGARTAPWQNPQWLWTFLGRHLPAAMRVTVVGFGTQCQVLRRDVPLDNPGAWPKAWAVRSLSHAVFSRALAWNRSGLAHAPRWLFTAGLAPWPRLKLTSLPFTVALTLVRPTMVDAGITNLRALPSATGVTLVGTVRCTGKAQVMLQAYRNGLRIADQLLTFTQAGVRRVRIEDIPPDDHQTLDYRVKLVGADPWPQDNQAAILLAPAHPESVLIVTRHPGNWLVAMGPRHWRVVGPGAFPSTPRRLQRYQMVVLSNIPQALLPPRAAAILGDFVRHTGGGLLIAGSCCAFGPGGYALRWRVGTSGRPETTLESLSPLASVPPNRKPVRVIFLIDESGSMIDHVPGTAGQSEFNVATHAVLNAVAALHKTDRVKIFAFNGQTRLLLSATVGAIRRKIVSRLSAIVPTGATNPDSALPALKKVLRSGDILIVLTDGRIAKMNVPAWTRLILSRHIKLVVVAPLAPNSLLTHVAAATGALRFSTHQFRRWPAMLRTALQRELAGKARTTALSWHEEQGPLAGITHAWIEVYQKAGAKLLAGAIHGNHPLAAVWRLGLGHVAALAFSEKSVAYRHLLQRILQAIVPPPGNSDFVLSQRRMGRIWRVRVLARNARGFINGADLS